MKHEGSFLYCNKRTRLILRIPSHLFEISGTRGSFSLIPVMKMRSAVMLSSSPVTKLFTFKLQPELGSPAARGRTSSTSVLKETN